MSAAAAATSSQDKAAESVYNYLQLPDVGWWGGGHRCLKLLSTMMSVYVDETYESHTY